MTALVNAIKRWLEDRLERRQRRYRRALELAYNQRLTALRVVENTKVVTFPRRQS